MGALHWNALILYGVVGFVGLTVASLPIGSYTPDFLIEAGTPPETVEVQQSGIFKFSVDKNDCGARAGFNDCDHDRERAERTSLEDKMPLSAQPPRGMHYRAKIFFPQNFSAPRGGMGVTVFQIKVPGSFPALDLFLRDSADLRLKMDHSFKLGQWDGAQSKSRQPVIIPAQQLRGRWHDIDIQAYWSDTSKGRVTVEIDGRQVFSYRGPNVIEGDAVYVKHGVYRWDVGKDPERGNTEVHFKDVTVDPA
ncbi:heparin lyase I family protein [Rhizobium sp. G187]|uniref:heparin lyase I family protein n=1 Tax=Rhizobium sp. G187 TaxID=3451352 RepID=UPI003EE7DCEA